MTMPTHDRRRRDRSSFQAWAESDGWIELQPLMVEQRDRCLVIDCIVTSARFDTLEVVRDLGHPAVLALDCREDTIDAAVVTIRKVMDARGTLHLLRDAEGDMVILLAGAEVWMLKAPER